MPITLSNDPEELGLTAEQIEVVTTLRNKIFDLVSAAQKEHNVDLQWVFMCNHTDTNVGITAAEFTASAGSMMLQVFKRYVAAIQEAEIPYCIIAAKKETH